MVKILALSLSINAWTFGSITGINYYKIDPLKGTQDSLMVSSPQTKDIGIRQAKLTEVHQCLIIASSLVQLPLSAVKISILFFYKRIFTTRKFRIAVWITIPFIVVWGIIFFVVSISIPWSE